MAVDKYDIAVEAGKKDVQNRAAKGEPTELPVLDHILADVEISGEFPLGLIDIPLELIAGTKTDGRANAFAPNFMPLLGKGSEFAMKWSSLCEAHLREGIHDPIKAYEYMNRYYVLEGNKRVSVMKYFGAESITGYVTRIVPVREDTKESRLYYEFLDFYQDTNINYLIFTEEGSYAKLSRILGHAKHTRWSLEERYEFHSCYNRFSESYEELGGKDLPLTTGDAMLAYIELFGYEDMKDAGPEEIRTNLQKMWDDMTGSYIDPVHAVQYEPAPGQKKRILSRILSAKDGKITKVAFVYGETAETSAWSYAHELGRLYLQDVFGESIQTSVYDGIKRFEDVEDVIERAVADGNEMIFTTKPEFLPASLKAAVNHPDVKILNCSLNASHNSVRPYFGRMFEAKFLSGALAGIMTDTDKIGYITNCPIHGMTAEINAFARGVKMVNPKAKVYLEWTAALKNQGVDLLEHFLSLGATYISAQDIADPRSTSRQYGLFRVNGEKPVNLALPVWNWGKYYELIIRSVQNGSWNAVKQDEEDAIVSYWWGMSSGVIDLILSEGVSSEARLLIQSLRNSMQTYEIMPFDGVLMSQNGIVPSEHAHKLTAKEIVQMDWLADNVIGEIPKLSELIPEVRPLVYEDGVYKQE